MSTKKDLKYVICLKCGWIAFEVSRYYAEKEIDVSIHYFDTATEEMRAAYGGSPLAVDYYEKCFLCGGSYKNFKDFKENDCPMGVTMNPIIDRND